MILEKIAGRCFDWQRMLCHQTSLFMFMNILAIINHVMDTSKIFKKYTAKAAMDEHRMHDLYVVEKVEKLFWDPV